MNGGEAMAEGFGAIRTAEVDGETWWVLADVCKALLIDNPSRVAEKLDDDEKGMQILHTLGGKQRVLAVNEFGLYAVMFRAKGERAREFTRRMTHEVLPRLRAGAQGAVAAAAAPPLLEDKLREPDGARLSANALAVYYAIRRLGEGHITMEMIKAEARVGTQRARKGVKELEGFGYLTRRQGTNGGRFGEMEYYLRSEPGEKGR